MAKLTNNATFYLTTETLKRLGLWLGRGRVGGQPYILVKIFLVLQDFETFKDLEHDLSQSVDMSMAFRTSIIMLCGPQKAEG